MQSKTKRHTRPSKGVQQPKRKPRAKAPKAVRTPARTKIKMRPNAELVRLAKKYPPPDAWFEKNEPKPF
jgi:hypothetical protein